MQLCEYLYGEKSSHSFIKYEADPLNAIKMGKLKLISIICIRFPLNELNARMHARLKKIISMHKNLLAFISSNTYERDRKEEKNLIFNQVVIYSGGQRKATHQLLSHFSSFNFRHCAFPSNHHLFHHQMLKCSGYFDLKAMEQ